MAVTQGLIRFAGQFAATSEADAALGCLILHLSASDPGQKPLRLPQVPEVTGRRRRPERSRQWLGGGARSDWRAKPNYSITSSAVICMISGTVRPSALAVLRLMTSSNFVGSMTGRSPDLEPLRIWAT